MFSSGPTPFIVCANSKVSEEMAQIAGHFSMKPLFVCCGSFQRHNSISWLTEGCYESMTTLKCLSIGTPITINFPFVSNEKLMVFRYSNIQAHYDEAVIYLNFGTPKNDEFSIWNKWKIYYF